MTINDPNTARGYLGIARERYRTSRTSVRWGVLIALSALIFSIGFIWAVSEDDAGVPMLTNTEPSRNPSPATK